MLSVQSVTLQVSPTYITLTCVFEWDLTPPQSAPHDWPPFPLMIVPPVTQATYTNFSLQLGHQKLDKDVKLIREHTDSRSHNVSKGSASQNGKSGSGKQFSAKGTRTRTIHMHQTPFSKPASQCAVQLSNRLCKRNSGKKINFQRMK